MLVACMVKPSSLGLLNRWITRMIITAVNYCSVTYSRERLLVNSLRSAFQLRNDNIGVMDNLLFQVNQLLCLR